MEVHQQIYISKEFYPVLNITFFAEILEINNSEPDKIKLKVLMDMDTWKQNMALFPEQEIELEYDEDKMRLC